MKHELIDNRLTVYPEGRIDTSNASEFEHDLYELITQHQPRGVTVDFEKVTYISSAGLRVLLRLWKSYNTAKIINVTPEVYEILDMTGFTEMLNVHRAFRQLSVEGCKVIGQGAKGIVYRWNSDTAVKVYRNSGDLPLIERERALAKRAFVLGVPTAISYDVVRVGDSYGSVFELLDADSFSDYIYNLPDQMPRFAALFAKTLRGVHRTVVKPDDMPDYKSVVLRRLKTASDLLPQETLDKLRALVNAVPDVMTMLHGDYHTNNVMLQGGEPLLIDMDTLAHGHPIFELGNIHTAYIALSEIDPSVVENFMGFSFEIAQAFWREFLRAYLATDDEDTLRSVESKIELMSYLRLIHHVKRRPDLAASPNGQHALAVACDKVKSLTDELDTLVF